MAGFKITFVCKVSITFKQLQQILRFIKIKKINCFTKVNGAGTKKNTANIFEKNFLSKQKN